MSIGVIGLIGQAADGALSEQGGLAGLLSGADLNQMAEQLDMSDPSSLAYVAWCKEYYPEKVDGTSSIWNPPGDVNTFRQAVTALPGYGVDWYWKDVIGRIDQNMGIKVTAGTGGAGGAGGAGGTKALTGGKVWVWPWEPDAFKVAPWWMIAVWFAIPVAVLVALWWMFGRKRRKRGKRRSWRRMNRRKSF